MKIRSTEEVLVLELSGELDIATSPSVLEELTVALSSRAPTIVIFDLKDVTFMDSSAIKCLLYAQYQTRARDGNVIVCNARPQIAKLIRILGLDGGIELHEVAPEPPMVPSARRADAVPQPWM